jgi:uncharacterized protein YecE (DUF72 family)
LILHSIEFPMDLKLRDGFKKTPNNLRFTAKFPKIITHDKHLLDIEEDVELFLRISNLYRRRLLPV